MPDPTLIVALKKKRLDRYGGKDDSEHGPDDSMDLRAQVESLEARVSAIEEKYGMHEKEDHEEGKEY